MTGPTLPSWGDLGAPGPDIERAVEHNVDRWRAEVANALPTVGSTLVIAVDPGGEGMSDEVLQEGRIRETIAEATLLRIALVLYHEADLAIAITPTVGGWTLQRVTHLHPLGTE